MKNMYVPDGLHPNDAGHAILANKLRAFLEQL
jgi:lysophospholipase L1-like esterase